jgi:hypothetical protein
LASFFSPFCVSVHSPLAAALRAEAHAPCNRGIRNTKLSSSSCPRRRRCTRDNGLSGRPRAPARAPLSRSFSRCPRVTGIFPSFFHSLPPFVEG